MKKALAGLVSIPLLFSLVVGCGTNATNPSTSSPASSHETTLEKAKKQGYVSVGFANEKPYAYATPDGKLTGEAVEVARAVLKTMGIKQMNGVLTEFGSLIPGLNAKRFDMITAGMYITPERAKQVAFANPEYRVIEGFAVKKGNPLNLHSYEDIKNNPKAKIAVMGGAMEYNYLLKSGVPKNQIEIVPDNPSALAALKAGRADAITMTSLSLEDLLKTAKDPSIEMVKDFKQPVIDGKSVISYGATAFRTQDKDFLKAFDDGLNKLEKSGQLLQILEKFGFNKDNLPGNVTAAELSK
ncbi:ectoine/hydroxyectoine ABC transporter substrate-binding protein EhuB [Fodinisporobacter ferrooxydans]|uniref:Ectoine/hydroxyectoine ABC transporter substrate-binding protein EhuB n=1 Tax=Fodinisporobacter ferrooxydans TaxID=2901836 RepID=A0ABY4CKY2_9BACL|nr:ectoine/hydroxyectoine ABC transporter substrate-binding protein EhuB [Alicyclobacillaceae bacterium MYW30-H2]